MFGWFKRKKHKAVVEVNQSAANTDQINSLNAVTGQSLGSSSAPVERIPHFEEVFEVVRSVFEPDPMNGAFDVKVDETSLRSVSLALCQGLRDYLEKSKTNPSDQDKGLRELGTYLERLNVYPVGFTQWSQDRKSTRLNSSHSQQSRMPSSA